MRKTDKKKIEGYLNEVSNILLGSQMRASQEVKTFGDDFDGVSAEVLIGDLDVLHVTFSNVLMKRR